MRTWKKYFKARCYKDNVDDKLIICTPFERVTFKAPESQTMCTIF